MSNAYWFWASNHNMSRKLLIEKFWCYCQNFWFQLNFLSSSSAEISDFNSDDEFSKELVKNNTFMFFDSNFTEISDFKSRFFFRNFWFLSCFLSLSSDFAVEISEFNFWFKLCSLFLYCLHVNSKINELWTNVMSLHRVNHMSVF